MNDNWPLEEKVNELVQRVNTLTNALIDLMYEVERGHGNLGMQKHISTALVRKRMGAIDPVSLLDLSPRTTEPYRPQLITRENTP